MNHRPALLLAAAAVALLLSGFVPFGDVRLERTVLRFQGSLEYRVGDEPAVLLLLETEAGRPIGFQEIEIYVDGAPAGTLQTDAAGSAVFRPSQPLAPGSYVIAAIYRGFQLFASSAIDGTITVSPAEIVVQTVPVIPGVAFSLGGSVRTTGPDGIARFTVDRAGAYAVELVPDQVLLGEAGAEFRQWFPGGFAPEAAVVIPGPTWVQAGFELSYSAAFSFVDPEGVPVDGARIESARLRGSDGSVHTFSAGETLSLKSNRILARLSGLDSVAVVHSVQSVIVDGVEVVNRGEQRFVFAPDRPIEIEVLFYDVRFYSRDVLFGLPAGDGFELYYQDGRREVLYFDETGALTVTGLARGDYEARLITRLGWGPRFPIVLSRDQEIRLPVFSLLDLLAGAGAAAAFIVGLPVIGRRRQILGFLSRPFQSKRREIGR